MVQQILFARNTEKVTTMNRMFAFNENITTIYVSDKFVTTALTNDEDIFINCSKLKGAIEYEYGKGGKEFANYTTGYFTAHPINPVGRTHGC